MTKKKTNLRALALAKMSGFRHKVVTVPEWDGAEVLLREPPAEAWLRWQEMMGNDDELSTSEKAHRNLRGDVTLFVDVILDTDEQPVFTPDDIEEVTGIYGPVHSRLLKQALDLITSSDTAKEK